MDWSNEFTIRFLELYKEEPCLWDPADLQYKRKDKVSNAWMRLSEETGKSVLELRRKKDSLMATFRGLLRKKKASIFSGPEGVSVYQPVWFAFQTMENFLGEIYGMNIQDMIPVENENLGITDIKTEDNDNGQPIPPAPSPPNHHFTSSSFQKTVRRRKHSVEMSETEKESNSAFGLIKKVESLRDEDDECDLYGRLLAIRLRKLPGWDRWSIMHEIDGLVLNAMHRLGGSSSTPHPGDTHRRPPHSTSFPSSPYQFQDHTEDPDIDEHDIITFEDNKMSL